ncbi:MAG: hypothetical protein COA69_11340 [Robiginitomaculum sp.]|nr:MAG: hypothetical protein COA69_11340 [Robiginitomaculum sp.]
MNTGFKMSRRQMIKIGAAGMAASGASLGLAGCSDAGPSADMPPAVPPSTEVSSGSAVGTRTLDRIGLQLYTVREMFDKDPIGTLTAVREIGYDYVESKDSNYAALDAKETRRVLDDLGLGVESVHVGIDALDNTLAEQIENAHIIGAEYITIPWLAESYRNGESWKRLGGKFTKLGEDLKKEGLQLAYHNHDFEFDVMENGELAFDILLANTDPNAMKVELDFYWAVKGGANIPDWFAKYKGRTRLCHVKDMDVNGEMVNVGEGTIDFAELIALQDVSGIEHYIVEHDHPAEPHLEAIEISYKALKNLKY